MDLLGEFNIESKFVFENTTVGGLSAITYDSHRDVYYLLSDDMTTDMYRFYTAKIDVQKYSVQITSVTFLTRSSGSGFDGGDLDPKGFVYAAADTLVMSCERVPATVMEFALSGKLIRYFNVPNYNSANSNGMFGAATSDSRVSRERCYRHYFKCPILFRP